MKLTVAVSCPTCRAEINIPVLADHSEPTGTQLMRILLTLDPGPLDAHRPDTP